MINITRNNDCCIDYNCGDERCPACTKGESHRTYISYVMAALESLQHELKHSRDFRVESLNIVSQLAYERFYGAGSDEPYPTGEDAPWSQEYKETIELLDEQRYYPEK